jgi:hypothetical protein
VPARNVVLSLFRRREPLTRRKEAALLKLREMLKGQSKKGSDEI